MTNNFEQWECTVGDYHGSVVFLNQWVCLRSGGPSAFSKLVMALPRIFYFHPAEPLQYWQFDIPIPRVVGARPSLLQSAKRP